MSEVRWTGSRVAIAAIAIAAIAIAAIGGAAELARAPMNDGMPSIHQRDNPASASIDEEGTFATNLPFTSLFNNLEMFCLDVPRNDASLHGGDLAAS